MRISIWQQFSSNNSSDFTVVGVFESPEAAQRAADETRQIIKTLEAWYDTHLEEGNELLSSGSANPSPAEIEIGKRFGFQWPYPIEWYRYASIEVVLDRLVYITTDHFRPDTAGEPFDKVLKGLGGQGLLQSNFYGDQIGTILVEIICIAPDEDTAHVIADEKLAYRCLVRHNGAKLHFYDWPFSELDLPKLLNELQSRGCTDIEYRLSQSELPEGKPTDPRDADLLIKLLNKTSGFERNQIAGDLGKIADPIAVEPLIVALNAPDNLVIWALGNIGDRRAVEPLIPLLGRRDSWTRQMTANALGKIGDARAIHPLIVLLNDDEAWQQVANALGMIGEAAREPLKAALENASPKVRERAAEALVRVNDTRDFGPSIAALRDTDPKVRTKALEQMKAERNIEPLVAYLRSPTDNSMLDQVIYTLGIMGDPRAVEPLTEMIRTHLTNHRLVQALVALKVPPVEPLIQIIRDKHSEVWAREFALLQLSQVADPRAVDVLIEQLEKNARGTYVSAVLDGLKNIGDTRAAQPIIDYLLKNFDMWNTPYFPNAVQALEKFNAKGMAVDQFIAALKTTTGNSQAQIIWMLGQLGDLRAIEPLLKLAAEQSQQTDIYFIREALKKLGYELPS